MDHENNHIFQEFHLPDLNDEENIFPPSVDYHIFFCLILKQTWKYSEWFVKCLLPLLNVENASLIYKLMTCNVINVVWDNNRKYLELQVWKGLAEYSKTERVY